MAQMDSVPLPPRLPLVVLSGNRNSTSNKDSKLVNCYIETDPQGEVWIYKRPGWVDGLTHPVGVGRGLYYWKGDAYAIVGSALYKNGVTVSGAGSLDTTGGMYCFSQILGATHKLVFKNNAKAYAYDPVGGLSLDLHSIDVDFPEETVPGIVYLNGASYVMQSGSQIWGSALNSVSVAGDWSAINFLAAQIEPDDGVALDKQLVYVIAFGQWSTEVFFDAGNPTGSPLGPVQGSKISYGCANAYSIQQIDDRLLWISSNKNAAVQVSMLEQLNHSVISTKQIDRLLQGADLSTVYSWQIKFDGHSFYVITAKESNLTLAYDITEGIWHHWADTNGNYIPIIASTYDADKNILLQHESNGMVYYADSGYYKDGDDKIVVDIITPIFDANTTRRKQMNLLRFVGDQEEGSILHVRHSDNDYRDWSNFRAVKLNDQLPMLTNEGTFVRRAYHLRHFSNTPLRLQALDVQYDLGTL